MNIKRETIHDGLYGEIIPPRPVPIGIPYRRQAGRIKLTQVTPEVMIKLKALKKRQRKRALLYLGIIPLKHKKNKFREVI